MLTSELTIQVHLDPNILFHMDMCPKMEETENFKSQSYVIWPLMGRCKDHFAVCKTVTVYLSGVIS